MKRRKRAASIGFWLPCHPSTGRPFGVRQFTGNWMENVFKKLTGSNITPLVMAPLLTVRVQCLTGSQVRVEWRQKSVAGQASHLQCVRGQENQWWTAAARSSSFRGNKNYFPTNCCGLYRSHFQFMTPAGATFGKHLCSKAHGFHICWHWSSLCSLGGLFSRSPFPD